jgi:hypothetical protein
VSAVDGDHLTIAVKMAVTNAPNPANGDNLPSSPTSVLAVRTASTVLLAHGARVDALDTPVGTKVAFAGPVADDGTVTLAQLEAPPEEPAKPTDTATGGKAQSGTAAAGTDRVVKGRGTVVALDSETVQVRVDDGPLAGQTITMPAPALDPSCAPATVGASVGFEAASSDGGTTWRLILLST